MIEIGLPQGVAFFRISQEFDGVPFLLDFSWNARAAMWFLDLFDGDGAPLKLGIGIPSNWPLLRHGKWREGMPAGDLIAFDSSRLLDAPGFDQLGTDVPLLYFPAAEIPT